MTTGNESTATTTVESSATATPTTTTVDSSASSNSNSNKSKGTYAAVDKSNVGGGGSGSIRMPSVEESFSAIEKMVVDMSRSSLFSEHEKNCFKVLLKDHDSLKEKTTKLKSLLGRSAKAQREVKIEAETAQKRLQEAHREIERLNEKVEKLATRPTHMELLADFETNFDRALLSVNNSHHHHQQQQAGGESTTGSGAAVTTNAPSSATMMMMMDSHLLPPNTNAAMIRGGAGGTLSSSISNNGGSSDPESAVVDHLLMQELQESKQRNEKLESLNSALLHRSSQLESENKERRRERDELFNRIAHLELEKRMAVMEAEHATKAMHEKAASLAEMQMEIDLVSKASVKAHRRAAKDEELIKAVKTDQKHVHQLEAQVQALQEWATAASEAKTLAQERVVLLESQLRSLQNDVTGATNNNKLNRSSDDYASSRQVLIWEKKGSLVIGAGDYGFRVFECDGSVIQLYRGHGQTVILKWQFDLTADDLSIEFSAIQGRCESKDNTNNKKSSAGTNNNAYLIQERLVQGGAAGELDHAFFYQDACTLLWSNVKSWVRPRTVRYTIQAVAVPAASREEFD